MLKHRILFAVILLATHAICFLGGSYTGRQMTINWLLGESKVADAQTTLGQYAIFRDIAIDIGAGKIERAKCNADLGASAMFDGVKICMLEDDCKARLKQRVLQSAPEILGGMPIPFDYISTEGDRKRCGGGQSSISN